jgi:23S rRNA pseudouridine2605 synthase
MNEQKNRLSKILAGAGVASRRAAEELITSGVVTVNGKKVLVPQTFVDPVKDLIAVNGEPIRKAVLKRYFILNKPAGYVCSTKSINSPTVYDLFAFIKERLFTVGRLDKETEGLIIVTNDGHFANDVIHPSSNIEKEYLAKTGQEITDDHLKTISKGTFVEGVFVKPVSVKKVRKGTLKVTVKEGKKHEVRVLLAEAGLDVQYLSRIRIGNLVLGTLPVGSYRELTLKEKEQLLNS